MNARGMTLMELLMVVVVTGVLASAAVMPQIRTLEAGKRRAARDILLAIYAGERVYWTANDLQYCPVPAPSGGPPPSCTWAEVYVDDPNAGNAIRGVSFEVVSAPPYGSFIARARRTAGALCNGKILEIDQTGTETAATDWGANGGC